MESMKKKDMEKIFGTVQGKYKVGEKTEKSKMGKQKQKEK